MHKNSLFVKGLVVTIILLFFGASVVLSMSGNIEKNKNISAIVDSNNEEEILDEIDGTEDKMLIVDEIIGSRHVKYWEHVINDIFVKGDSILLHQDVDSDEVVEYQRSWTKVESVPNLDDKVFEPEDYFWKKAVLFPESSACTNFYTIYSVEEYPVFCWEVRHADGTTILYDFNGECIGRGTPAPSNGVSISEYMEEYDPDGWRDYRENADYYFSLFCDYTSNLSLPTPVTISSYVCDTSYEFFYEIAHGSEYYFQAEYPESYYCSDERYGDYYNVSGDMQNRQPMKFAFIGSCEGMNQTDSGTFSYEFRKGQMTNTVTVGYDDMTDCPGWEFSLDWQDLMFSNMFAGLSIKDAFNIACSFYPTIADCVVFVGDNSLTIYDQIEPEVFFVTPSDGEMVSDNVRLWAGEYSGAYVTVTDFYLSQDGEEWILIDSDWDGTEVFSANDEDADCPPGDGWTVYWDVSDMQEGWYYVKAIMWMPTEDFGYDEIQVYVEPTPPIPTFIEPDYDDVVEYNLALSVFNADENVDHVLYQVLSGELVFSRTVEDKDQYDYLDDFGPDGENMGAQACFPTATAICLKYWNDSGYPEIMTDPDTGDPISQTILVESLAKKMKTGLTGTADSNVKKGIIDYLNEHKVGPAYPNKLVVSEVDGITPNDDGTYSGGEKMNFAKYKEELEANKEDVLWGYMWRKYNADSGEYTWGGHMVVGTGVKNKPEPDGTHEVTFMNPAGGVNMTVNMHDNGSFIHPNFPGRWCHPGMMVTVSENKTGSKLLSDDEWTTIATVDDPSGGWSAVWDTTTVPDGIYFVRATLVDDTGWEGKDTVVIEVKNEVIERGWTRSGYDLPYTNYYPYPTGRVVLDDPFDEQWNASRQTYGQDARWRGPFTGDVTGDGKLEVIYGYAPSAGVCKLYVFDDTGVELWNKTISADSWSYGTFYLINMLANITGDNALEIFVSRKISNTVGEILIYDGYGNLLKTLTRTSASDGLIYAEAVIDQYNDGHMDVVVGVHSNWDANPRGTSLFNYTSSNEIWHYAAGNPIALSYDDINDDGLMEFTGVWATVGNGATGSGLGGNTTTTDSKVWTVVINENGWEIFSKMWTGSHSTGSIFNIFVDLNKDGTEEILSIHGTTTADIHLLNATSGAVLHEWIGPVSKVNRGWAIADINNDGYDEVVIVHNDGMLRVFDYTLSLIDDEMFTTGIKLHAINDINGDGNLEILVSEGSILKILNTTLSVIWSYTFDGTCIDVIVSDLDGDHINEIIAASDKLYVLEASIVPGDANGDGIVNISDVVFIINYLFVPSSPAPIPLCSADANGDGMVNVSDAVYIINYLFIPGFPPPVNGC